MAVACRVPVSSPLLYIVSSDALLATLSTLLSGCSKLGDFLPQGPQHKAKISLPVELEPIY